MSLIKKINPHVIHAYAETRRIFQNEMNKLENKIKSGQILTEEERRRYDYVHEAFLKTLINEMVYINENVWLRKRFWKKHTKHIIV